MDVMSDHVQELISPLLDRQLAAEQREKVLAHLQVCRECDQHLETIQNQRKTLLRMDLAPVPSGLSTRLRVLASHERERQRARFSFATRRQYWLDRLQLFFENMMRPVALPLTGGFVSTMVIFSVLVPSLTFQHHFQDEAFFTYPDGQVVLIDSHGEYVQAGLLDPKIVPPTMAIPDNANVVRLTVDETGKVRGWSVAQGRLTPELLNVIMFSQFRPATNFGVPTVATVNAVQRVLPGARARS
jgi:hypothetical protein